MQAHITSSKSAFTAYGIQCVGYSLFKGIGDIAEGGIRAWHASRRFYRYAEAGLFEDDAVAYYFAALYCLDAAWQNRREIAATVLQSLWVLALMALGAAITWTAQGIEYLVRCSKETWDYWLTEAHLRAIAQIWVEASAYDLRRIWQVTQQLIKREVPKTPQRVAKAMQIILCHW